jgi:glycosyltransferase involved in cell wall biosynthesis
MRVGVYLVELNPEYAGGLTTYAVGLVNGLLDNTRGHEVVLFVSDRGRPLLTERVKKAAAARFVTVDAPARGTAELLTALPGLGLFHPAVRNRRMAQVAEQIAAHCEVVLFPLCFMATYRLKVPSIVSFHDLQHETFPQFFNWRSLRARRVRFGATFRHASVIQASSQAMKQEALRVYGDRLTPERIAVIPEGVDYSEFAAPSGDDARARYNLPQEFVFYPAQLWPHKNHLRLLEALLRLRTRNGVEIPLVLTGSEYEAAPAVRAFVAQHAMNGQVFLLGRVPYPALRSLYEQTSYVISASLHESNCLPLLEAAASGSAVILADIPPNRESAQVFRVRLFDPLDINSIAATLLEAWAQRHENQPAVEANRAVARRFDWSVIANLYLDRAEQLCRNQS